jgi:hypothetical protein
MGHSQNKLNMNNLELFLFGMRPEFLPYFRGRKHIWIEKMDLAHDTEAVQKWILEGSTDEEKNKRLAFVLYHISETGGPGGFTWFFTEKSFSIDEK